MIAQGEPLRQRRDLRQIIQAALQLYGQHMALLFQIAAVVVPLGVASAAFQAAIDDPVALGIVLGVLAIAQAVVNLLVAAALIAALAGIDQGRPADFSHAYDVAFARFWTLAGAILRVLVVVGPPYAAFFGISVAVYWGAPAALAFAQLPLIPFVLLATRQAVRWIFVEQAVMLDETDAKDALSRSAEAVLGSWWRTLGIALVIGLIGVLPASIIAGAFLLAPPLVAGTVNSAVNAAILPLIVISMTMLYFDLKLRKDGAAALPQPPVQPEEEIA